MEPTSPLFAGLPCRSVPSPKGPATSRDRIMPHQTPAASRNLLVLVVILYFPLTVRCVIPHSPHNPPQHHQAGLSISQEFGAASEPLNQVRRSHHQQANVRWHRLQAGRHELMIRCQDLPTGGVWLRFQAVCGHLLSPGRNW